MKRVKTLGLLFVFLVSSGINGFCYTGINPEQPLSSGEDIYMDVSNNQSGGFVWLDYVKYTYAGFENNSIKVEVKKKSTLSSEKEDVSQVILPLNGNKQALLKILPPTNTLKKMVLRITVVDEFYRIKVEEFKEKNP